MPDRPVPEDGTVSDASTEVSAVPLAEIDCVPLNVLCDQLAISRSTMWRMISDPADPLPVVVIRGKSFVRPSAWRAYASRHETITPSGRARNPWGRRGKPALATA